MLPKISSCVGTRGCMRTDASTAVRITLGTRRAGRLHNPIWTQSRRTSTSVSMFCSDAQACSPKRHELAF